jgi:hypothetical protein
MIQHPFVRPGVALIFTSYIHGTGKDTLLSLMGRVIGRHAVHYTSSTLFWDKHDVGKEGAILIHLEEACSRANKAKAGELKAIITANTISINPKGVRGYSVPNISRIVMTTNEADPVKLEASDRRFVIMRPSDRLHGNGLKWWASIQELLESDAMASSVGRYLESIDLTGWNPRELPTTEVKEELMELSKPMEQEFLEFLRGEYAGVRMTTTDLYHRYKTWYCEQGMDIHYMSPSPNALCKKIAAWNDRLYTKARLASGWHYTPKPLATAAGGAGADPE